MRSFNRGAGDLRPVVLTPNVNRYAEGSCQVEFGNTKVLITCSVEERVPPHLMGKGSGWVTAEYGMLPRATHDRNAREAAKGKQTGRTQEIQRLIGRSLRASVDLSSLGVRTYTLDCDVLQADGGTRTASITGAYVAMVLAMRKIAEKKGSALVSRLVPVSAVSVGIHKGEVITDLDYDEDSGGEVDLNVVALEGGRIVEVQGTAEKGHFTRDQFNQMLDSGLAACVRLNEAQAKVLASK